MQPDPSLPSEPLARDAEIERLRTELVTLQASLRTLTKSHADELARLNHQLRGPLSPIMTAIELLKTSSPADTPRIAAVIGRQIKDLVRIVDTIGQAAAPPA